MSAMIDRMLDDQRVHYERVANSRLSLLGDSPYRGRIERARDIMETIIPDGWVYEFDVAPTGPIRVIVNGYTPPEVNRRFEP